MGIMAAALHPCSACSRHVLTSEESCPFCGAALSPSPLRRRTPPKARMSRAALVALGTLAASPQVACGGAAEDESTEGDGDMSGDGDGDMMGDGDSDAPVYGIPPTGGTGGVLMGSGGGVIYGAPPTGGAFNEGGMGGETSTGGLQGGPTGGAVDQGTGGDQVGPEYGIAPLPLPRR